MDTDTDTDKDMDKDKDRNMDKDRDMSRGSDRDMDKGPQDIGSMKRLFLFKILYFNNEAKLSLLHKCQVLKRSSDNIASKVQNIRSSDNIR